MIVSTYRLRDLPPGTRDLGNFGAWWDDVASIGKDVFDIAGNLIGGTTPATVPVATLPVAPRPPVAASAGTSSGLLIGGGLALVALLVFASRR